MYRNIFKKKIEIILELDINGDTSWNSQKTWRALRLVLSVPVAGKD